MLSYPEVWTIGVEEEYQVIDPDTRSLSPDAHHILSLIPANHSASTELQRCQVEIATPICHTLEEVRTALLTGRRTLLEAANQAGRWLAASATHPFSHWRDQDVTPKARYYLMEQRYQQLVREQVILGCHVHIGCPNRALALEICNRARSWLSPLLALSANSPFWLGDDTGYASYRTEIWCRWPLAGPPPYLASLTTYTALLDALLKTESIADTSHLYWDIRLSDRYPTIEFRIMDICLTVAETVMIAGLLRALVQTCARQVSDNIPFVPAPTELLRVAHWRAARYGLDGDLLDIHNQETLPAPHLIERFLTLLRPALDAHGDWESVSTQIQHTLRYGNGATRQRTHYNQTTQLRDVVDFIVSETARDTGVTILNPSHAKHA